MFALRRIAARAVFAQPARQLSTLRPAHPRTTILQTEQASLYRSFHQSRRCLADAEKVSPAEAEATNETVTTEPSPAEQKEIREESVATPDVVEQSEQKGNDALSRVQDAAGDAVEAARDIAARAAATFSNAASPSNNQFPPPNAGSVPGEAARPSKILYVGNLFFEVTTHDLEDEFRRFGEITNSRIVTDARGQHKGFGYIEFATQESADRAVQELDQKSFRGRRMAVQYHVRRQRPGRPEQSGRLVENEPSTTLFIGNMSYQMSDRDLNDLFREIKNVLDVRVAIDRRSGQPRGFAHADFVDVASAQRAKEHLEQKIVYGRQLRIDYSKPSSQTLG